METIKFTIVFLFCVFFFSSCNSKKESIELLEHAEKIIDTHPDSALHLLMSIDNADKISRRNRAKYALLLTKAKDKNYITHTSDSLINTAVDYYANERNNKDKAEAYFYLGSVYRDMGLNSSSIEAFLKALEIIPQDSEDRLRMLLYDNLAKKYEKQEFYDKAMEMAKQAHSYNLTQKNKRDLFHSSRKIGKLFLFKNNIDSTLFYYQLALEIAISTTNQRWESMILCDIARVYNERNDLEKAYKYVNRSILKSGSKSLSYPALFLKGKLFAKSNQIDSARHYLLESLNDTDIHHKAANLQQLYDIEKIAGNYLEALEYNDLYILLRDSITRQRQRMEISALTNEHIINLQIKNDFIKQQKQEFIILLLSLIIVCLGVFLVLTIKKRRKEQIISLQKELSRNRISTLNLDHETELEITPQIKKNLFFEKLNICISLFKMNESSDIIHKVQKNKKKEKHLSLEEREKLKKNIYENFIDVIEVLKTSFDKLTDADIYCCILYLLNCDHAEVSICMGVLPDTLKVRRSRIKNKLSEEYYNLIFKD